MFLKALEIQGFKSFPDRTRITVGKGITAVVGPNGSGKSNISDAIRWVLGETSAKQLRGGGKMENVIFGGTQQRGAMGFASVSLVVDNTDRRIDVDNDEVTIGRKYYRSGDSEYSVNGQNVRLKDIYELFLDTGLGRDGYSVIGQGRIAEIVGAKSNERREIFEEASGIAKYRYRKNEAERRLASAEENLVRLRDILGELEERVGPLERESKKAKQYLELAERRKGLEVTLWVDTVQKARDTVREQQRKIEIAGADYARAGREIEAIDAETESTRAEIEHLITEADRCNAEIRAITEEIAGADSRIAVLENDIAHNDATIASLKEEIGQSGLGREAIAAEIGAVQQNAMVLKTADALLSLAQGARENDYVKPTINEDGVLTIVEGRHPIVERTVTDAPFVPNDVTMDTGDNRMLIITGPNMAGKSTYMRQVALIVLMAQMGAFVPAASARIGVVDRIFTRIGASDDLSAGQSTFMVEMTEVADILRHATKHSLLILDEIGRGTSTFDGMSIARAVLEFCADKKLLGAKTLFATHYHELTELENTLPGTVNYNIAVKTRGEDIIFLRKILPGGADRSYGIEVAKLAGLPDKVVQRAKTVLKELEAENGVQYVAARKEEDQVSLTAIGEGEVLDALRRCQVETLTPLEAMNLIYE